MDLYLPEGNIALFVDGGNGTLIPGNTIQHALYFFQVQDREMLVNGHIMALQVAPTLITVEKSTTVEDG